MPKDINPAWKFLGKPKTTQQMTFNQLNNVLRIVKRNKQDYYDISYPAWVMSLEREIEERKRDYHKQIHQFCNTPYGIKLGNSLITQFDKAFPKLKLKQTVNKYLYSNEWQKRLNSHKQNQNLNTKKVNEFVVHNHQSLQVGNLSPLTEKSLM